MGINCKENRQNCKKMQEERGERDKGESVKKNKNIPILRILGLAR